MTCKASQCVAEPLKQSPACMTNNTITRLQGIVGLYAKRPPEELVANRILSIYQQKLSMHRTQSIYRLVNIHLCICCAKNVRGAILYVWADNFSDTSSQLATCSYVCVDCCFCSVYLSWLYYATCDVTFHPIA